MSEGVGRVKTVVWSLWFVEALTAWMTTRAGTAVGSRWSARSEARTNDLDVTVEWRRLG
jgi:hypothetical protein